MYRIGLIKLVKNTKRICWLLYQVWISALVTLFTHYIYPGPPRKSWDYAYNMVCMVQRRLLAVKAGDKITEVRDRLEAFKTPPAKGINLATRVVPGWCRERSHIIIKNKLIRDLGYYPGPGEEKYWQSCVPLEIEFNMPFHHKVPSNKLKTMLYIHGGIHVLCSVNTHRRSVGRLCKNAAVQGASVEIRLSPEHPFPCSLEDALASYIFLTSDQGLGVSTSNIVFSGDSSGGGIVASLLVLLTEYTELGMPRGALLMSPWVDLVCESPSALNAELPDYLPSLNSCDMSLFRHTQDRTTIKPHKALTLTIASGSPATIAKKILERGHYYVAEALLTYPLVSPLYSDKLHLLPPLLVTNGECERILDDGVKFSRKVHKANLDYAPDRMNNPRALKPITHQIYEDMVHCFSGLSFNKTAKKSIEYNSNFIKQCLADPEELVQVKRAFPSGNYLGNSAKGPVCSWKVNTALNFYPADTNPEFAYLDELC